MTGWTRLPIRVRLTVAFAVGLALSLAALGAFVYMRTGSVLLAAEDAGLRSRAEVIAADVRAGSYPLAKVEATLIEGDEWFAQITDSSGRVLDSSPNIASESLLPPAVISSAGRPTLFDRTVPGIGDTSRVLLAPVDTSRGRVFVVVGASLQDRHDSLVQLAASLGIGGAVALGLLSFGAWVLVGRALRPVERMRQQAAEISATDSDRRLSVTGTDEIAQLSGTLNAMLDRVEESLDRERRLIDRASHELRTPLAIQRMDLDLALSGPQTADELQDSLRSVSEENDHLIRLANDLLLLSRARDGELPITRTPVSLAEVLEEARERNLGRAREAEVTLETSAPEEIVAVDPGWLRQAIDNLVENAIRHTPAGGRIELRAQRSGAEGIRLVVEDSGSGFSAELLDHAFEPFSRSDAGAARKGDGTGLGLTVVRTIAEAHGGEARAENRPEGGARVILELMT
jgi:signal transduction histidine kinase